MKRKLKKHNRLKDNPNRKVTLRVRDIDKMKEQATANALEIINLFPLLALRDEYGFGKKRMQRYIDRYNSIIEAYNEGYIDLEDIHQVLKDEVKIDLKENL